MFWSHTLHSLTEDISIKKPAFPYPGRPCDQEVTNLIPGTHLVVEMLLQEAGNTTVEVIRDRDLPQSVLSGQSPDNVQLETAISTNALIRMVLDLDPNRTFSIGLSLVRPCSSVTTRLTNQKKRSPSSGPTTIAHQLRTMLHTLNNKLDTFTERIINKHQSFNDTQLLTITTLAGLWDYVNNLYNVVLQLDAKINVTLTENPQHCPGAPTEVKNQWWLPTLLSEETSIMVYNTTTLTIAIINLMLTVMLVLSNLVGKCKTKRRRQLERTLSTAAMFGINLKGASALATIKQVYFFPQNTALADEYHIIEQNWTSISIDDVWGQTQSPHFENPGYFWSQEFGLVVAEKVKLKDVGLPMGTSSYWEDPEKLERMCLCTRQIEPIEPPLSTNLLFTNNTITRSTGLGWRHVWKYEEKPRAPNDGPDGELKLALSIWIRKIFALLNDFATIQSNCVSRQIGTQYPEKPPEYGKYSDPTWIEPDTLIFNTWHIDYCNDTNNPRRWVYNCGTDTDGCIETSKLGMDDSPWAWTRTFKTPYPRAKIECQNLEKYRPIYEAWKANKHGKDHAAWLYPSSPSWNPSCGNKWCLNLDSHTLYYKRQTTCHLTGDAPSFEPIETDILVQTQPDQQYVSETGAFLAWRERHKQSALQGSRVKWIQNTQVYYADSPQIVPFIYAKFQTGPQRPVSTEDQSAIDAGVLSLGALGRKKRETVELWDGLSYTGFPSMMQDDPSCQRRVKKTLLCKNLFGNMITKLAFFDKVQLDPAKNEPVYPSTPVFLRGTKNTHRSKRQITVGVFLLSAALSALAGGLSGMSVETILLKKMHEMQDRFNTRFNQDENNLRQIATRINALQASSLVKDQAINRILVNQLKQQEIDDFSREYLQKQVSENRRLIIENLGLTIKTAVTYRNITLPEAEINQLVITQLQNLTGTELFHNETVYLARLFEGALSFTKYAERTYVNETLEQKMTLEENKRKSEQIHRLYHDLAKSENKTLKIIIRDENITKTLQPFNLNASKWHPDNITLITNGTLWETIGQGIAGIPVTISKAVEEGTKIVGKGLSYLGKTSLGTLLPLIVIIIVIIVVIKVVRKKRQQSRSASDLSEAQVREMLNAATI